MKTLKLKNHLLFDNEVQIDGKPVLVLSLQTWLQKQLLHGKLSRARTRFIKLVGERAAEIDQERRKIAEDCTKKDKKGRLLYEDKDGKETTDQSKSVRYKMDNIEKFVKEFNEYLDEELVLDVTPQTQDTIYGTREIVLDTKEEFSGIMAVRYNEWSVALENITEKNDKPK